MSDVPTRREGPGRQAAPTTADPTPGTAPATTRETPPPGPAAPATGGDDSGLPQGVSARFSPVRHLATGGEAHLVMLVEERATGLTRVAKVYPTSVRPDPRLLDALRTADERHVVRMLDYGTEVNRYGTPTSWEVLEYLPHGSLAALARAHGGPLPPQQVRRVVAEVTDALAYLHGQLRHGDATGIAHRDIKPENVLVRSVDPLELVLCDFGLVAELRATRRSTGRAGTPAYQAPETWWQKSQEPAQDWWSLGVLVVELLTGRNPNSGVGGDTANERTIFEHIATYGVDLSGVTDLGWLLLCRGLLTRAPALRWGADQVRAWLAGETPAVDDPDPAPEPEQRPVPPFELAGRLCRNPAEVGVAMSENWQAAVGLFRRRESQLDLDDWLRDNFPRLDLPTNLMKSKAAGRDDAAARVVRFVSHVAPELPPVFEDEPADGPGLAGLAARAVAGEPAAAGIVARLDAQLLRALARHRCRAHPGCADGPCAVLADTAERLARVTSAVDARAGQLGGELAAGATGGWPRGTPPELDQALPVARALALRLLVDPDHGGRLRATLARQKRAAGRCDWWERLREEAGSGGDDRQVAAAALAAALIPFATARMAAEKAAAAEARQRERNADAARAGWVPPARATLRNVWRDAVNYLLAVAIGYLTTFAAAAFWTLGEFPDAWARPAVMLTRVAAVQTAVALPLLALLACLVICPADAEAGLRRARRLCWAAGAVVWALLTADDGTYAMFLQFPVVLDTGVRTWLTDLATGYGEAYPYVAGGGLLLAVWLGRRLAARAYGTEGGRLSGRVPRGVRGAVIALVAVLYLLQPVYVWQGWAVPLLPEPTRVWWLL
ncbi:protein kinase domain-containing protein [Micromonospora carbonacea]|uniref:Serine/threonine-protein kinase n=1 Tax=Micromonospora carbonacea TaxID=47853 RepID=A0A7H8XJN0_9ACTN|nr:protein kinase [Micromonospora carbonacea]MBB5827168.1 serine/threonine protein kinase [Micromonospora carbonacea]QLD25035.1 serine/threonine-protein kinase [Micromonospora carbonacea]